MQYNPSVIAAYFDEYGIREWSRLFASPANEVNGYVHDHYLRDVLKSGDRVLEIGPGPGRFTRVLDEIGCRIVVADLSPHQLELNREKGKELGFERSVEAWVRADICDLQLFCDGEFDAVVAYGGPLSYAMDNRKRAMEECGRVVRDDGVVLVSVLTLWGSVHEELEFVMEYPRELNARIIATGDLNAETQTLKGHYCHLYCSGELRQLMEESGLRVERMSASNVLSNVHGEFLGRIRADAERWQELLAMELQACASPGYLDGGPHLIAVGRR